MKIFLFIIKSVGLSLLAAIAVGVVWGLIKQVGTPSHPHQMLPTYMVYAMFMVIVDFFVAIATSITMLIFNVLIIKYAVLISVAVSFVGLWVYFLI